MPIDHTSADPRTRWQGEPLVRRARTFRQVKWHPGDPAEDSSFFDVRVFGQDTSPVEWFIYFPHLETKSTQLEAPEVLKLPLPFVWWLHHGTTLRLEVSSQQIVFEP